MGRVKNIPTPRGAMLGDYIAKAHTPKPAPPTIEVEPADRAAAKSSGVRSQAVKLAKSSTSTSRGSQNGSSSASSNKRKSADIDDVPKSTGTNATKTLALRSSRITSSNGKSTLVASAAVPADQSSKRQKIEEPPRRTTRLRRSAFDAKSVPSLDSADDDSARTTRTTRKSVKAARNSGDEDQTRSRKEAIDLLQGPRVNDVLPTTSIAQPSVLTSDVSASDRRDASQRTEPYTLTAPNLDGSPLKYAPQDSSIRGESDVKVKKVSPNPLTENSAARLPPRGFDTATPLYDQNLISRLPSIEATDVRNENKEDKGSGDNNSATSGDSGYVTAPAQTYPPPTQTYPPLAPNYQSATHNYSPLPATPAPAGLHPMYAPFGMYSAPAMSAVAPATYGWPQQAATPWSVPDMGTHTFIINTSKGQKVKGRPVQRVSRQPSTTNRTRNVANTYPRKQPFKAQINFEGYPAENEPIRADATLWEICQEFPNHLIGDTLRAFVQKEWSANELCACLKDDARKVLTDRPGKDKTMVFQKRLERVKKDSIAQGEYDALINGPELRLDGRPSWVKRGNVRRR